MKDMMINYSVVQIVIKYFNMTPIDVFLEYWSPYAFIITEEKKRKVVLSDEYEHGKSHSYYITVALYEDGNWIFDHKMSARKYIDLMCSTLDAVKVKE